MKVKHKVQLFLFFFIVSITAFAQNDQPALLNIGDPAPLLKVGKWIQGNPIKNFEKGKVYVIDFWATWCKPCMASMPYLSALAQKYENKATFLAVAVWENGQENTPKASPRQIKALVDSMGNRMNFFVAIDDSDFMADNWVKASYEKAIPLDFMVDAQGRIAWIGNPVVTGTEEMDRALSKIIENTWDIKKALSKRVSNKRLEEMDWEANDALQYNNNWRHLGPSGKRIQYSWP